MNDVRALAIFLPRGRRVGILFRYELARDTVTTRFVADDSFIGRSEAPTLSLSLFAEDPDQQQALWKDVSNPILNGRYSGLNGWLLPAFFQNLLPEGVFRDFLANLRGCDPKDHFELLAACGKDLPGGLYAQPVDLTQRELAHLVTQDQDALEMSVTAAPLADGVSLSGVQPKLGAVKQGDQFVAPTKDRAAHIIAKLPVVGRPRLPELEELSLRLANAAGVNTCTAYLAPLDKLAIEHGYDLGGADGTTNFLAVERFDRPHPSRRVHCEDFAQVLGIMPEDKYGVAVGGDRTSYLVVAAAMGAFPSLGEVAQHELLRRLAVNELLGNPDMHLKNIGLLYADARTPQLSPAYDVVGYAAYSKVTGHALLILPTRLLPRQAQPAAGEAPPKQQLSPAVVRTFCAELGIPEKPAMAAIQGVVRRASEHWPKMLADSNLTSAQKQRLTAHVLGHRMVQSIQRKRPAK